MKCLLSLFSVLTLALSAAGQCDMPQVISWDATDASNINIDFEVPEGATAYHFEIRTNYGNDWLLGWDPFVLNGTPTAGINTAIIDATLMIEPSAAAEYYYTVKLWATCADGGESPINEFYVSPYSLLNLPGFDPGMFYRPMEMSDFIFLDSLSTDVYFVVGEGGVTDEVESLSVFIDWMFGAAYIVRIELLAPTGQTVVLFDSYGGNLESYAMSISFEDGAAPLFSTDDPTRGIYSPEEPLSALTGIDPSGVWRLRAFREFIATDVTILYGVGLNINGMACEAAVEGQVYYDFDNNGLQDTDEPAFDNALVTTGANGYNSWGSSGAYSLCTGAVSDMLTLSNPPLYYAAPDIPFTVAAGDTLSDLDFPLISISDVKDLSASLYNTSAVRPGFEAVYLVQYSNVGTECVEDVNLHGVFDEFISIVETDNPDLVVDGSTFDLALSELCPVESGEFTITVLTDDTVSLGALATAVVTLEPDASDANPANNEATNVTTVVGSYDPNDKTVNRTTVSPMFLAENHPLEYMIRFQNTGNYYAERVMIVDTLDANLDPNTFVLKAHSHPVEVARSENVFYFEFDEIFLPDSTADESGSHGYIAYEAKPYSYLADGTAIENKASIFFDFNEPIHTNTVASTVDFTLGLTENRIEGALIYPNPTQNNLHVVLPGAQNATVALYDLTGRTVYRANLPSERLSIPVGDLAPGLYLVEVSDVRGTAVRKIVVE